MADSAPADRPVAGMVYCAGALLAFASQDTIIKYLTSHYPVLEVLTLRTVVVIALLVLVGGHYYGRTIFRTNRPGLLLLRGVLAFFAFTSYYVSLSSVPLADAAAVYMTAPLFVTLLSIPILGERVGLHRFGAIIAGFAATIIMLKPGSEVFRVAAALPLISALCYAAIPIINRRIGLSQHVLTMAIYTTISYLALIIVASIISQLLPNPTADSHEVMRSLLEDWRRPELPHLLLVALSAAIFVLGLLGITHAYRISAVSIVAPAEYSYIVWATLLGFFVFADVPSLRVVLGALVVVAAGMYVMYREREAARR